MLSSKRWGLGLVGVILLSAWGAGCARRTALSINADKSYSGRTINLHVGDGVKVTLAEMAVAEHSRFRQVLGRLEELDADADAAMQPFVHALDAFHARTRPADWIEGLVKAYVSDGISADFYRTIADLLDPQTQALVYEVLADTVRSDFVVARVRAAIVADPPVAGRLALWARRIVGEALGQAQRVAAEREPLARLLAGGDPSQLGKKFAKLADGHSGRMAALGLVNQGTGRPSATLPAGRS